MNGWRNSDLDDNAAPLEGAWLIGLALLAVLAITSFVLIAVGVLA